MTSFYSWSPSDTCNDNGNKKNDKITVDFNSETTPDLYLCLVRGPLYCLKIP